MNQTAMTPEPRTEYGIRDRWGNVFTAVDDAEATEMAADPTLLMFGPVVDRTVVQRTVTFSPWDRAEVKP